MFEYTSIYFNQIKYSRQSTLELHDVHSTSPFFFSHQRPGWVQLLAIFSCNRLGVDMSRYKTQFKCARCVHGSLAAWTAFHRKWKKSRHQMAPKESWTKNFRFRKSTSCKAEKPLGFDDKISIIIGAGFWPLAGCSASQPLPKMWEARKLVNQWFIPLVCVMS